jgi:ankyrin repeat protein
MNIDDLREPGHNPERRQLLAAAVLPGLERLLTPLSKKPDSYTEWFDAIHLDDASRCRQLLQRGFDPNTIEPERFDTGLILSVRKKAWKVFGLLLSAKGVQLDARSRNGDTALMIAAFNGEAAAAARLIDKGAEINRPGWTALHYAAASGNLPIVRNLLDHSAYIDAESPNKTTPLMMAARAGHEKVVILLLEEGADVMMKNELGLDAIDFAKSQERTAIVRILAAWQARASTSPRKEPGAGNASFIDENNDKNDDENNEAQLNASEEQGEPHVQEDGSVGNQR